MKAFVIWAGLLEAMATAMYVESVELTFKSGMKPLLDKESEAAYPNHASTAAKPAVTVDLGYEIHEAVVNDDHDYYAFNNIPYALPPEGELRWQKPHKINYTSDDYNDGTDERICHQMQIGWGNGAFGFIAKMADIREDVSEFMDFPPPLPEMPEEDERAKEDCLLLDVYVPQDVFNQKGSKLGADVMVWIHGGGYIFGHKAEAKRPLGLLGNAARSGKGIIWVSMNYRLGAFGWLASTMFQAENGTANAGFWDQRLAIQWVKENIGRFGGNPNSITVFGESAGASSIMHHLTAFQGKSEPPDFQRAIMMSPGFFPQASRARITDVYEEFKNLTKLDSLEKLRGADEAVLAEVSNYMTYKSMWGQFTWGPSVDAAFSPALPIELFQLDEYHKNVEVMVGYNLHEGWLFTPPHYSATDALFKEFISLVFPAAEPSFPDLVAQKYPVKFQVGVSEDRRRIGRTARAMEDVAVKCNALHIAKAYGAGVYQYDFSMWPGFHGQDVFYTYFDRCLRPGPTDLPVKSDAAEYWQTYLTNFAMSGDPNGPSDGLPAEWKPQGTNRATLKWSDELYGQGKTVVAMGVDGVDKDLCDFWESAGIY